MLHALFSVHMLRLFFYTHNITNKQKQHFSFLSIDFYRFVFFSSFVVFVIFFFTVGLLLRIFFCLVASLFFFSTRTLKLLVLSCSLHILLFCLLHLDTIYDNVLLLLFARLYCNYFFIYNYTSICLSCLLVVIL